MPEDTLQLRRPSSTTASDLLEPVLYPRLLTVLPNLYEEARPTMSNNSEVPTQLSTVDQQDILQMIAQFFDEREAR
jgi:hypothetical protein